MIICVLAILLYFRPERTHPERQATASNIGRRMNNPSLIGILNYQNSAAERGATRPKGGGQKLSKAKGELVIVLPKESEAGEYLLRIHSSARMDETIATYAGKAFTESGGVTKLRTSVDFSSLPSGSYVAAWQRTGTEFWDYGSFIIE